MSVKPATRVRLPAPVGSESSDAERATSLVVLTLVIGGVILIGLIVALTLIPAQLLSSTISAQVGIQQEQLAGSLTHQMETLFNVTANDLLSLTERPEVQSTGFVIRPQALSRLAELGSKRAGQITSIVLFKGDGTPIYGWPDAVNQRITANQPLAWSVDSAWIQHVRQTSGVQFLERSTGSAVVYLMAAPVTTVTDDAEVLTFELDVKNYFTQNFSTLNLSANTQLWVFDLQGKNLYQRHPAPDWTGSVSSILTAHDVLPLSQVPTDDRTSVIAPVYTAFTQDRARTPTLVLVLSRITAEGQAEVLNTLTLLFVVGLGVVLFVVVLILGVTRFVLRESRRRSTVRTLLEMSRVLNSSLELPVVLQQILKELSSLLPHDSASVMLLDEDDRDEPVMNVAAKSGMIELEGEKNTYLLSELVAAQQAIQTGKPLIIGDIHHDARWKASASSDPIHAWLGVPLTIRGTPIGVLNINSRQINRFTADDADLAKAFADQACVAIQNARAFEMQIHQYEAELETARAIQNSLMPSEVPPMPHLEIAAQSLPARQVSGDYYQYLPLPDGRLGVAVGDVSGKGIPAALLMAVITTSMREEILRYPAAAALLDQLNSSLQTRMQANHMNSALTIALFEPNTRRVELSNGGMIQPYLRTADGWESVAVSGYPVGAAQHTKYTSKTLMFAPNAMLVFISDGVIEAQNARREFFGFERLEALLARQPLDVSCHGLIETILSAVSDYRQGYEAQDDITVVVVKSLEI